MEQLIIEVGPENTSAAIKEFAGRFADTAISTQDEMRDSDFYEITYGMDKKAFETKLNIGIAQSLFGMTKPWDEVKAELIARISNKLGALNYLRMHNQG